jgi:translation initiation factor 5B
MAPKKKGNKKAQNDDWEAELGETVTPQAAGDEEPKAEEAGAGDEAEAGGLMAALQRRGKKKKNKGPDFELEGEDPPVEGAESAATDFESKAPQEGNFDDEEDVFAGNYGKKKAKSAPAEKQEEPQEDKTDDGPRVKTKAEKEKEKKEKEKQRKKELVSLCVYCEVDLGQELTLVYRLRRRRLLALRKPNRRPPKPRQRSLLHLLPPPSNLLLRVERRRS